ncbi:hypothetical protein QR680_003950 [Steinernema hermaphroditum]|uniref:Uncharacterized protein n=1 Tax=Steinernema hermaphroditum TaxID=289476 RepID=A0AA39HM67_9BILA|nr:hypothetical protein QR680_003950 [Steinernema hermaphroditum]
MDTSTSLLSFYGEGHYSLLIGTLFFGFLAVTSLIVLALLCMFSSKESRKDEESPNEDLPVDQIDCPKPKNQEKHVTFAV